VNTWQQKETLLQKQIHIRLLILCLSLPPKQKKMKGREECEMLEKVLLAFQVHVLIRTGNSSSNPEQA
jgi:hypothetical protein